MIYAGLPLWLCAEEACNAVWGFWAWLFYRLPFNGFFFVYQPRFGAYWAALWAWLRSVDEGEG